jgi:hypothetical protein
MLFLLGMLFAFPGLLVAQTYNIYFGDIHSHTWYSDGNQDQTPASYTLPVARSMTFTKSSPNMDFLGISDHNHIDGGFPMTLALWRSGVHEADSVNQDGTFAALYGQEWGTTATGGGHSLVYGTSLLFGWNPGIYDVYVAKNNFTMLVDSLKKYGGFIYFAHPATDQFGNIFTSAYNAKWDSVVAGVAVKNGPSTSTNLTETDPSTGSYEARYHDLLKIGYHVAPCANQDNHNTTFGRANQQRTVVLATSLTKANVVDALRNMRTYATEDHNLQLRFESGTHQMGEIYSTSGNVPLRVKVVDAGESFTTVSIRYGIPGSGVAPTTLSSVSGRDSLVLSQPQSIGSTYYYYAYVQEADGNEAWSAPIWVTVTAAAGPPAAFNLTSPANSATNQPVSGTLSWGASSGATGYDVYLGTSSPGVLVSSNQAGTSYNYSGLAYNTPYFWKVVAKNGSGNTDATSSPFTFTTSIAPPSAFALIGPSTGSTNQAIAGTLSWNAASGATSYDVYLGTSSPGSLVSPDQVGTTYNYSGLANNATYFWKVVAKNAGGSTTATASPWNFATIVASPGAFTQTTPTAGAVDRPVSGTLSWQASANAATYDVYLDTIAVPTTIVSADQAGTSYNYGGLLNSKAYYWKIVAKNAAGTLAASNAPLSFTTVVASSGAFSLLSPSDGATNQPHAGTLVWGSSLNATSYDVYLDTSAAPTTLVSADQVDTSYAYSGLQGGVTYRWKVIAKNIGGSVPATATPFQFTTMDLPAAPTQLVTTTVSATTLQLGWQDNALDETGYRVLRSDSAAGPFTQVGPDLPAGTVAFTDGALAINTRYYYRIIPFNGLGEGNYASISPSTMAVVAGSPVVSDPTYSSLRVTVNPYINPLHTQFAIRAIVGAETKWAQANGSVGASPAWRTYEEWGGSNGIVLSPLVGCNDYGIAVLARSLDNVEADFSEEDVVTLNCFSVASTVAPGWNLVSLPVNLPDQSRLAVFPTSTSAAFAYEAGYTQRDTLARGEGYWLKFSNADPVNLIGEPAILDSIPLLMGWNIIGSVSSPVSVGAATSVPGGIISSPFYSYGGSYTVADSIRPLQGYWVKANAPGLLVLSSFAAVPASARPHVPAEPGPALGTLTFSDALGHAQSLTLLAKARVAAELPPPPPAGTFDVRFSSQRLAEHVASSQSAGEGLPICLQSTGPVEFAWDLSTANGKRYELTVGSTVLTLSGSGSTTIPAGTTSLIVRETRGSSAIPSGYALHQNYPNPFNPSTQIRYDLPVRSNVRLTVYSILGTVVASLVNGEEEPGFHSISWTPEVSSGIYLYRLEAVSTENPSTTFQKIFRMVYLK